MDIVLALLPWAVIWTAAINKREKIGALFAMSLGILYELPQPPHHQGDPLTSTPQCRRHSVPEDSNPVHYR